MDNASGKYSEFSRATAICVNLALDSVESEVRAELAVCSASEMAILERIILSIRSRRISPALLESEQSTVN